MNATQVRHPWRATLRTVVAVALVTIPALGIVVPEVVDIILDEYGAQWAVPPALRRVLLGVAAVTTFAAGVVTRVMAIPQVDSLLGRLRLSAEPAAAASYNPEHA